MKKKQGENPKIIVFCCNWSVNPGLRLSVFPDEEETTFKTIVTMCCGRVGPELILEAFTRGAWGVMLAGCPPEECEHDGNYKARKRVLLIKKTLEQFNIEPERVALEWFSTGESDKLKKSVETFIEKIVEYGPLELSS
ncbi:methyl-viologen-reducing hydrogenase subunit delta [bacterium]|nr:MAG: methyl-viologen-reducing hydrogenase subunit delta [bacterium]